MYEAQLLTPDGALVETRQCANLSELAHAMITFGGRREHLDDLGEVTVMVHGAGGRHLTDAEGEALTAILEEWGGFVPRDDTEVGIVRFSNPDRRT